MRLIVERDVPVEMRDGTVLRSDIYRPDRAERFPVLLQRTPYDKNQPRISLLLLNAIRAASAGYPVMVQDVRGRFASDGEFYTFRHEPDDGYDTIAWAADQPWSSGKVGMFGLSYVGATQWLSAIAAPPALGTIVPVVTASDYHEGWTYQGGAFEPGFNASENAWRQELEWPLARTQYTPYYLHSQGRANSLHGDGALSPETPGMEQPDRFLYDPRHPVPTRGGPLCCWPGALPPLGILGQVRLELAVIGQDHTALRSALPSAHQRDRRLTNRSDPGTIASQTNVWHILPHVSLSHAAAAQKERMPMRRSAFPLALRPATPMARKASTA